MLIGAGDEGKIWELATGFHRFDARKNLDMHLYMRVHFMNRRIFSEPDSWKFAATRYWQALKNTSSKRMMECVQRFTQLLGTYMYDMNCCRPCASLLYRAHELQVVLT